MALNNDKESEALKRRQLAGNLGPPSEIFHLLVDAVEDYAIFALDVEGNILTWNLGAERLKGYDASEIIGTHFSRFYEKADIDRNHPHNELLEAAAKGKYEEEGWRLRKNGERFWANVVITALRDGTGKLLGFGKVTRDLTERKIAENKLRESEARFRLMVESVNDYAIFMLNPDGLVVTWNKGAERNTGYQAHEIIGQHFSKFYLDADLQADKPHRELVEAVKNEKYEEEGWRIRKDGTEFWAYVTITAVYDPSGTHVGFAKVTRNLTEQKKTQDELRKAYTTLEERIQQRTKELSEAKLKAEDAVKVREHFFSIASHELKTPLSSLKLQVQMRKRAVAKGDFSNFAPELLADLCNNDERQINRLTFLVDNMLDVSKISAGVFELYREEVELNELLKDVLGRAQPIMTASDNICSFKSNSQTARTLCDRYRIEQVLWNLLSNASKYASGKPVEVILVKGTSEVTITVRDHGQGIPKDSQIKVFNAFQREDSNHKATGLGLGLYIVRQIVEAHGGRVLLESNEGQGAAFSFTLPCHETPGFDSEKIEVTA